jgi:hypothetical protein
LSTEVRREATRGRICPMTSKLTIVSLDVIAEPPNSVAPGEVWGKGKRRCDNIGVKLSESGLAGEEDRNLSGKARPRTRKRALRV